MRGPVCDRQAEIEKRKPDFEAYVAPQKQIADAVIQVRPPSHCILLAFLRNAAQESVCLIGI
jgi:uridine kinase